MYLSFLFAKLLQCILFTDNTQQHNIRRTTSSGRQVEAKVANVRNTVRRNRETLDNVMYVCVCVVFVVYHADFPLHVHTCATRVCCFTATGIRSCMDRHSRVLQSPSAERSWYLTTGSSLTSPSTES